MQCIESEVKMAVLVACSNIPIAFNDRYHLLSELYLQILKWPQCIILPEPKQPCSILNIAVDIRLIYVLVKHMKCHAFS